MSPAPKAKAPASRAPSSRAVVERRKSPLDALDFFPTPPWATRALLERLDLVPGFASSVMFSRCWEPACGAGHMSDVLAESFRQVYASDVHDYGYGYAVGSFTGVGLDVAVCKEQPHWIITNPPFNLAEDFLARALREARSGVALLLRTAWVDGEGRYERIFSRHAPHLVLQFAERVPMVAGQWDPDASTATAYAWFVWLQHRDDIGGTRLEWVAPKASRRLSRPDDIERFAQRRAADG